MDQSLMLINRLSCYVDLKYPAVAIYKVMHVTEQCTTVVILWVHLQIVFWVRRSFSR